MLALELGSASLVAGKLTADQLAEYRRHAFLIEGTGNSALRDAYNRLTIQDYLAEALRPRLAASQKITQDHLDLVSAFERGDLNAAQRILTEHTERSKETMRAGIQQAGSGT